MGLIENLINNGYLISERIIAAFRKINRIDFLPEELPNRLILAELDQAIPIGHMQTISQPAVVALMLELLDPRPGQTIMDIGYGSGWTTALLAHIVTQDGAKGKIAAIERIKELANFGKMNIEKYGFINNGTVRCVTGDGSRGYPPQAPYDRILASAAAASIPNEWKKQLKVEGIIVAPKNFSLIKTTKKEENVFINESREGFAFVPLVRGAENNEE